MCGICGELRFDGGPVQIEDIAVMSDALVHRGPDDAGLHCEGPIGLGHRRLAIIDLSPNGRQPMWTKDGRQAIVFNGEIYNFAEIRQELVAEGYAFDSNSDTEVLLNAVHCWGIEAAVSRFIGMFAFAIWNAHDQSLTLCRDRVGVKPLYYYTDDRRLLFGSELKALLAHPAFPRELDHRGLGQFFVLGYSLGEATTFRKTSRVLPGHAMRFGLNGRMTQSRYWSIETATRGTFAGSFADAREALMAVCDSAFRYRLVADVPVGLFLSGGTDSSLLAAILKKRIGADLLHMTMGFTDKLFDESQAARAVADELELRHVVQNIDAQAAQDTLVRFADVYDEPFGDTSGIPTSILCGFARTHVKVALSADGGDEQFCGYPSYATYAGFYERMMGVPSFARRTLAALGRLAPFRTLLSWSLAGKAAVRQPQRIARYEKLLTMLQVDSTSSLLRVMNEKGWTVADANGLFGGQPTNLLDGTVLDVPDVRVDRDDLMDALMRSDYTSFLRDDILTKVDRASMAVSLECREPFLDHRLAELAFSFPVEYLFDGREHKHLLKSVLRNWLSDALVSSPKKGFSIPLYDWLRGPWRDLVGDYLSPSRIKAVGVLDAQRVAWELDVFYRHRGGRAEKVMLLLLFQMWAERWYLGPATPAARGSSLEMTAAHVLRN